MQWAAAPSASRTQRSPAPQSFASVHVVLHWPVKQRPVVQSASATHDSPGSASVGEHTSSVPTVVHSNPSGHIEAAQSVGVHQLRAPDDAQAPSTQSPMSWHAPPACCARSSTQRICSQTKPAAQRPDVLQGVTHSPTPART